MDKTTLIACVDDAVRQAETLYSDLYHRGLKDYNLELRISVADDDEDIASDLCEIFVLIRVRARLVVHAVLNQGQGMGLPRFHDVTHAQSDWGSDRAYFSDVIHRDVRAAVRAQIEIAERESLPLCPYLWSGWQVKAPS